MNTLLSAGTRQVRRKTGRTGGTFPAFPRRKGSEQKSLAEHAPAGTKHLATPARRMDVRPGGSAWLLENAVWIFLLR